MLGGALGCISYFMRRRFVESSAFSTIAQRGQQEKIPILTLISHYKTNLLLGVMVLMPVLVSVCLLFFFTPGYLTRMLGYSAEHVAFSNALNMLLGIPVCIGMGWLADHYNRYWLMGIASGIVAVCAWPVFAWYATGQADLLIIALVGAFMWGSVEGIAILLVVSSFPITLRYTGMACSYNICATVFAGMGTVIGLWLIRVTGDLAAPAYYLMLSGVLGSLGAFVMARYDKRHDQKQDKKAEAMIDHRASALEVKTFPT